MYYIDVEVEHATYGRGKIQQIDLIPEPRIHVLWGNGDSGLFIPEELEFVAISS